MLAQMTLTSFAVVKLCTSNGPAAHAPGVSAAVLFASAEHFAEGWIFQDALIDRTLLCTAEFPSCMRLRRTRCDVMPSS